LRPSRNIQDKLEKARQELLDLSMRNRLLNTARTSNRSTRLEIVDEVAREIFRILVQENASMTFLARPEPVEPVSEPDSNTGLVAPTTPSQRDLLPQTRSGPALFDVTDSLLRLQADSLPQPEDAEEVENDTAIPGRHTDRRLQTDRSSEQLQTRLLWLFREARTAMEEQGANLLYLATGFLKWYESPSSNVERFAPLLLIPIEIERTSAGSRFRVSYTGEDITTNLSLQSKLRNDFQIELPEVPSIDELVVGDYFESVRSVLHDQPRWDVLENDMLLWLFSFSNFLMYRDLDPVSWPSDSPPTSHPLITGLLGDGFTFEAPLDLGEIDFDEMLPAKRLTHVLDADSSQAAAIEMVRSGRDLVIQGPPGTGKSQTIANMIATAVKDGQRVLFISEKLAALEVVKRRLDAIGLGDMCLELHSRKARKKQVLDELQRTHGLGPPQHVKTDAIYSTLDNTRRELNHFVELMHTPDDVSGLSPYRIQAELIVLQADGFTGRPFELPQAVAWTHEQFQSRIDFLQDLTSHLETLGTHKTHPWRGVNTETFLPSDRASIVETVGELLANLSDFGIASRTLAEMIGEAAPVSLVTNKLLVHLARHISSAPSMDHNAIGHPIWEDDWSGLQTLLQTGRTLDDCRNALSGLLVERAWQTDVTGVRRDLAANGDRWWRWFYKPWRTARSQFRELLADKPPRSLDDQLQILDHLIEGRRAISQLEHPRVAQSLASSAFGSHWHGDRSDWNSLEAIVLWVQEGRRRDVDSGARQFLTTTSTPCDLEKLLEETIDTGQLLRRSITVLTKTLNWDLSSAFDVDDVQEIPLQDLKQRLTTALEDQEGLFDWIAYQLRWRQLAPLDLAALGDLIAEDQVRPESIVETFRYVYLDTLFREVCRRFPKITTFRGESHEQVREKFQEADVRRIELARQEVATAHHRKLPGAGAPGELRTLEREWRKQRSHIPLRRLLAEAGRVIQQIKPVFMMSPQSVAQFLGPGIVHFDLLLVDEASQVRPVDALGAIARSRQLAVVGDHRQLPPTSFFRTAVSDDVPDSAERDTNDHDIQDLESILDVCATQGVTQSMLEWHYRSRHESLITVSNAEFYDSRLKIIPGSVAESEDLGLRFHLVQDGVFDRGGTATNRAEAIQIADAVMVFARTTPNQTLGVGAFSVRQRDQILDQLELRRRQDPTCEEFFATSRNEPFFVKNLENIQGDERDVILISIGYGPDRDGRFTRNFGPLNRDGGERRLNVLITRARERCEVYSSFTADQLDLGQTPSRGVRALKTFLQFAETGRLDIAMESERGFDSPFEEEVFRALTAKGYDVRSQIGTAGFFIDLAIVDPDRPGRYLIGIECDGASYHSSAWARDRDRLRQAVLEDRDWVLHRIWSTDWFYRPQDELQRAVDAIERSRRLGVAASTATTTETIDAGVKRVESADDNNCTPLSAPYQEADFTVRSEKDIHLMPLTQVAKHVARIIDIEGPIHSEEIARRLSTLTGRNRTGRRITDTVLGAIARLKENGAILNEGEFYESCNQSSIPVRDRSTVNSNHLRKPQMIPPREIRMAVRVIVTHHTGVTHDETTKEVARILGFRATSAQLRQHIEPLVTDLLTRGELVDRIGRLYIAAAS